MAEGVYPINETVLEGSLPIKTDECGKSFTLTMNIHPFILSRSYVFSFDCYTFFSVAKIIMKFLFYIHFEITGGPYSLIRS